MTIKKIKGLLVQSTTTFPNEHDKSCIGAVRRIASKSLGVKGLSNEHLKKIDNSCKQILSQGPMN